MKYPTNKGVAKLVRFQLVTRQCMVAATGHRVTEVGSSKVRPTLWQSQPSVSCEELENVVIGEDVDRNF